LDTQDFLDVLKTWTDSYRDARGGEGVYSPASDDSDAKWEDNMMKIVSVISPADSLIGTPAHEMVKQAVGIAKLKDRSKLKKVYELLNEVEKYLSSI
jgi:hypothetical protein